MTQEEDVTTALVRSLNLRAKEAREEARRERVQEPVTITSEEARNYLSAREAAKMLGVSQRSVYSYIKNNQIPALCIGDRVFLHKDHLTGFVSPPRGRKTSRIRPWHRSTGQDQELMTFVEIRCLPGQSAAFAEQLASIHKEQSHPFPGTVARSIGCCLNNPEFIQIVLVWKKKFLPSDEERREEITAFLLAFEEFLDLDTATIVESQALFHA